MMVERSFSGWRRMRNADGAGGWVAADAVPGSLPRPPRQLLGPSVRPTLPVLYACIMRMMLARLSTVQLILGSLRPLQPWRPLQPLTDSRRPAAHSSSTTWQC
jgi:hypothetical protein